MPGDQCLHDGRRPSKKPDFSGSIARIKIPRRNNDNEYANRNSDSGQAQRKEEHPMSRTTHHGGRIGHAASTLASKSSSKSAKSKAGKTMASHKAKYHSK